MKEEQLYDKIDAYLKGELPPEEQAAFEQKAAEDPALQKEVELARQEQRALRVMLEDGLAAELEGWDWEKADSYKPLIGEGAAGPSGKNSKRWWRWGLFALAVLLLVLFYFNPIENKGTPDVGRQSPADTTEQRKGPAPDTLQRSKPSQEPLVLPETESAEENPPVAGQLAPGPPSQKDYLALAESFYTPTTFAGARRSAGRPDNVADTLSAAMAAYNQNKLQETIRLLEGVQESDPVYASAQLVLGRAYFESGAYRQAGRALQEVMDSPYEQLAEEAQWPRLLCYLATGERESAALRQLLDYMADENNQHPQRGQALRLKERLVD